MAKRRSKYESRFSSSDKLINDVSDNRSVHTGPGVIGILFKYWWASALLCIALLLILKSVFPVWGEKNKEEIDKVIRIADTPISIVKTTIEVTKKLMTEENMVNLKYVGTGLHPVFKADPEMKKDYFSLDGNQKFLMKKYVWESARLTPEEAAKLNSKGELNKPLYRLNWEEANTFCEKKGGRLPTYEELVLAEKLVDQHKNAVKEIKIDLKPNLQYDAKQEVKQWTSTAEGIGWTDSDNYRVYTSYAPEKEEYLDDGDSDTNLSFRCLVEKEFPKAEKKTPETNQNQVTEPQPETAPAE